MRQPDFDVDLSRGQRSESELRDLLLKQGGRVEVKTDLQTARTGNVYVEYECQRQDGWKHAGILESKSDWYAFRLPNGWILCPKDELKTAIFEAGLGRQASERDGSHPTHGFVVPIHDLTDLIAGRFQKRGAA